MAETIGAINPYGPDLEWISVLSGDSRNIPDVQLGPGRYRLTIALPVGAQIAAWVIDQLRGVIQQVDNRIVVDNITVNGQSIQIIFRFAV